MCRLMGVAPITGLRAFASASPSCGRSAGRDLIQLIQSLNPNRWPAADTNGRGSLLWAYFMVCLREVCETMLPCGHPCPHKCGDCPTHSTPTPGAAPPACKAVSPHIHTYVYNTYYMNIYRPQPLHQRRGHATWYSHSEATGETVEPLMPQSNVDAVWAGVRQGAALRPPVRLGLSQ